MKKYLWAGCFGLALTAFTAYISLDTFVLRSTYQTNADTINTTMFESLKESADASQGMTEENSADSELTAADGGTSDDETRDTVTNGRQRSSDGQSNSRRHSRSTAADDEDDSSPETSAAETETETVSSDSSYRDENISITLTEYYQNDTKIYVADVQLTSAEYLKTAFADDTYGKNVTDKTSSIAASNNAILAVNGDYYGARERGYVIRNGVVYRDTPSDSDLLCIYANGTMKVMSQSEYTADELVGQGVWQALAFGPGLVENGSVTVSENDEVGKAMASNPRTAIGIVSENHYLFVVSDGRTSESAGLSLYQLAQFMKSLGAETAYNLDGGGSSTMYFNGQVINNPTTSGRIKERGVSDIVYIG
ncbi:Exopolysaccharide biosynthesis protein [Ruminococcus sp. YE71]|uniref:phosphodiester glycosidase family protein n=1 Tax=unclassified Ruminococcus TaxID=2608920 RepID=UPI000889204E|nr:MULTISPECIES: phosphodiester glycosidase family protein [unclassified Ruminococcus]SDA13440.1 Exopolysaccharide biosynthesis protein [Ruminococcus sp. YE78]SFW19073.1 Exopolysaccharide biosynthesis protein [Ruminococcus sp. YE71]